MKSVFAFALVILSAILFAGVKGQQDKTVDACDPMMTQREHFICIGSRILPPEENPCKGMSAMLGCLMNMKATCSSHALVEQLNIVNQTKEFCESTQRKIEETDCYKKGRVCTEDFHKLYSAGKYVEAKKKIEQAKQCLNGATCEGSGSLDIEKDELDSAVEMYDSGVLTGKCNLHKIEKCQMTMSQSGKEGFFTKCNSDNEKAAKKCIDDLKPDCVSDKQVEYYGRAVEFIQFTSCSKQ